MAQGYDAHHTASYPKASEIAVSAPMECKICEMGCGARFLRPIPLNAKLGKKWCDACLRLTMEQRERQFEEHRAATAKASRGLL